MLDVLDAKGATVIVPIELNARKDMTAVMHIATSAYGKEKNGKPNNKWFSDQAAENALYINIQKYERWTETSSGSHSLWVKSSAYKVPSQRSVFTQENLVKLKQTYPTYYQSEQQQTLRGATVIHADRSMRIELFADANFSTFAHESAHFILEDFADMARSNNASTYIKEEFARICQYLGADVNGKFTREQHEQFARSFEAYQKLGRNIPETDALFCYLPCIKERHLPQRYLPCKRQGQIPSCQRNQIAGQSNASASQFILPCITRDKCGYVRSLPNKKPFLKVSPGKV